MKSPQLLPQWSTGCESLSSTDAPFAFQANSYYRLWQSVDDLSFEQLIGSILFGKMIIRSILPIGSIFAFQQSMNIPIIFVNEIFP